MLPRRIHQTHTGLPLLYTHPDEDNRDENDENVGDRAQYNYQDDYDDYNNDGGNVIQDNLVARIKANRSSRPHFVETQFMRSRIITPKEPGNFTFKLIICTSLIHLHS